MTVSAVCRDLFVKAVIQSCLPNAPAKAAVRERSLDSCVGLPRTVSFSRLLGRLDHFIDRYCTATTREDHVTTLASVIPRRGTLCR